MLLRIVALVFETAPSSQPIGRLFHVEHSVSEFLMDLYAVPLDQVVTHHDHALFRYLVGSPKGEPGRPSLGRGVARDQLQRAVQVAIVQHQMTFLEELLPWAATSGGDEDLEVDLVGQVMKTAALHGNRTILEYLYNRHVASDRRAIAAIGAAVENGQLDIMRFLVQKHPLLLVRDASWVVLHAIEAGRQEIVHEVVQSNQVRCAQCLVEAALRHGRVQLASWLEQLADSGLIKTSKSKCNQEHTDASEILQNQMVVQTLAMNRAQQELVWVHHQFPDVFCHIHRKLLVWASQIGDLAKVTFLYHSARVDNQQCQAAVTAACLGGHLNVVTYFVHQGHEVHCLDEAVQSGNVALVRFLQQECGVSRLNDVDRAIDAAARKGHLEMVKSFDCERKSPYRVDAFCAAAKSGDLAMLAFLLTGGHDDWVLVEALLHGFSGGQLDAVKLVCEAMAKSEQFEVLKESFWKSLVDLRDLYSAHASKQFETCEHMEVLRFLVAQQKIMNPRLNFCGVIQLAIRMRQLGLLKLLLEKQARGFAGGMMNDAVRSGSLAVVRFLHENTEASCGSNAMDFAAANGLLHIVEFLHKHRTEGCTSNAMVDAASRGHWRVVKFLHEYRSEGDLKRAFSKAIEHGQLEVVKYVFGVAREELDVEEALCHACENVRLGVVQWFVENCTELEVDVLEGVLQWVLNKQYVQGYYSDRLERAKIVALLEEGLRHHRSKRRRIAGNVVVPRVSVSVV